MSSDLDDQWLYGDSVEVSSPTKVKDHPAVVIEENGNGTTERAQTPTLDDMEVALNAPSLPAVSKIISTAPDLQPKQPQEDSSLLLEEENAVEEVEAEGEVDEEGGDSESDEDDVQITIGEITTAPGSYNNRTPSYGRMPIGAGSAIAGLGKKVDVDAVPQIGGQSLLEFDLDEAAAERPWRLPGADIADYFNYGFTEDTWKLYCEKQRKMRGEINQLNKIVVRRSGRPTYSSEPRIIHPITSVTTINIPPLPPNMMPPGFLPPSISSIPPPPFMPRPPVLVGPPPPDQFPDINNLPESKSPKDEMVSGGLGIGHRFTTPPPATDNASDGRTTPGVDIPPSSSKPPLLPPPIIPPGPSMGHGGLRPPPPPFGVPPPGFPGLPPGQDNIAAAMAAAMFGGGIRPPDSLHSVPPPHMMPNMPQFHPPPFGGGRDPGGMPPPPFPGLPPNFPMSMDHGPMLDERSLGIPPDILSGRLMGQGFPWDPSMGQPPQEFLDVLAHHNDRRASRSRSRTSSFSRSRSRSSSMDDRPKKKRDRRHRRHSRSRSRSYEREHRHRSGRHHRNGDYHRSDRHERDRERERDRDRDRERERESRRRRDHREEKTRHERSSRRHRSISRSRDEERERSSRKEKSKAADQELSRDCRSRSKTP